jgi:hypothetical protein
MKNLLMLLSILSMVSFSAFADEIDDLFAGGEDQEFEFERFSEDNIMKAISSDAGIVCKRGLCTLSSVNTKYKEFTINMNGGLGNNASGGFGGFGDGDGTFINLGEQPGSLSFEDRLHAGINMQLKVGSCVRNVNIPRSLYYSVNRYMYGLMNEDSTTRRSFTPADEAMILFYTTIMKQANGCK